MSLLCLLIFLDFHASDLVDLMIQVAKFFDGHTFGARINCVIVCILETISLLHICDFWLLVGLLTVMLKALSVLDEVILSQPSISVAIACIS